MTESIIIAAVLVASVGLAAFYGYKAVFVGEKFRTV